MPISAEAASTVGALVDSPNPSAPSAAATAPMTTITSGPLRSITRPVKGSTSSAAAANAASTAPAVPSPRSRTRATYTKRNGTVKPLPNAASALPSWIRRSAAAIAVVTLTCLDREEGQREDFEAKLRC